MNKTGIEYMDFSWNPTHGCEPISTGCKNCWAKAMSKRLAGMNVKSYSKDDPFKVVCCPEKLKEPLKIKRPSRIGVSFMGDLFHDEIPFEFIDKVFDTITDCSRHIFQILTKRPERALEYFTKCYDYDPICPDNIWFGVSIENQKAADERIPILLDVPAKVRFVSIEPLLNKIDLQWHLWETSGLAKEGLDWVIVGSESGPKARLTKTDWVRSIRDQCIEANVPFFLKQLHGKKKVSMPKFDGKVWDQYPQP